MSSPSYLRLVREGEVADYRRAQNRRKAPTTVSAEGLVNQALMVKGLPAPVREHLEEQSAVLSDLANRGREISVEAANELYRYVKDATDEMPMVRSGSGGEGTQALHRGGTEAGRGGLQEAEWSVAYLDEIDGQRFVAGPFRSAEEAAFWAQCLRQGHAFRSDR